MESNDKNEGIDYEIFAHVSKMTTIRMVPNIATFKIWTVH